jgi:uncharacterized protein
MSDPAATAASVVGLAQAGRFDDIREQFAPALQPMVTAEALRIAWEALSPVSSVGLPVVEPESAGVTVVKVPISCAQGEVVLIVATARGRLAGLQMAPAEAALPTQPWQAPAYADPDAFNETEVTLGAGTQSVPGSLCVPRSGNRGPAVMLVGGSGPQDRDGTIGPNKPYRDLAWGLATSGVAVLRFDKVTVVHAAELSQATEFTLADEYLPQALAAVDLLRDAGSGPVVVAGHSLGGTIAPRIAQASPVVAGLVILAGGATPLHWSAVRQVRYIASLDPATEAASRPAVDAMSEQARRVDSPDLSPATPPSELPFGVPAAYWLDLRAYRPVEVAAGLGLPMLVLQGGSDYQSTVDEDLAVWRAGLQRAPGVTIQVVDDDDHFFFTRSGPSTPADYLAVQHVDPRVVAAVADWVIALGKGS